MAANCEGCGVAIEEGAFLGRCAECNQSEDVAAPASVPRSGVTMRMALIVGCAAFLLFALMMLVAL